MTAEMEAVLEEAQLHIISSRAGMAGRQARTQGRSRTG